MASPKLTDLPKVYELFPGISYEHVNAISARHESSGFYPTGGFLERLVIDSVLDNLPYPTEKDLKRKKQDGKEDDEWHEANQDILHTDEYWESSYVSPMHNIMKSY